MTIDPTTDISSKVLWVRAKDQAGATGSTVTTMTDQSGTSHNPTPNSGVTTVTGATPSSGRAFRLATASITLPNLGLAVGTVTASSSTFYSSPTYIADNLNDGNSSTEWAASSGSMPQWVKYRITAGATVVTQYTIQCVSGFATAGAPSAWTVEGSNDDSSWTTLDTRSSEVFSGSTARTFTFSNSTAYLYYRISISAKNGGTECRMAAWTLGGITAAAPVAGPGEMWIVVKSNTTGGSAWTFGTSGSSNHYTFSGTVYTDFGNATRRSYTPTATLASTWRLIRMSIDSSGNLKEYIDEASQLSATGVTRAWNNAPKLSENWSGDIAEVLIRSTVSTSGEIADLITYFNTEHGMSVPGGSGSGTPQTFTGTAPTVAITAPAGSFVAGTKVAQTFTGTAPTVGITAGAGTYTAGSIGTPQAFTGTAPTLAITAGAGTFVAGNTGSPQAFTGSAPTVGITAPLGTYTTQTSASLTLGVDLEVGALTLLDVVTLDGATIDMGTTISVGTVTQVQSLPGTTIPLGMATIARPEPGGAPDPRTGTHQWRYVVTELDGTPLGELDEISHDPVLDGVNVPTAMKFVMSADDPARALIEADEPMARKCQVWEGENLLLWGPILPDLEDGDGTAGYTVHDPSWWWRGGRRVIGRFPRLDLLRNGDFRQGLNYWTRGYDAGSIPAAAPAVTVVSEDLLDDSDNVDPIKAARIVGVESVTQTSSELSSNAVFWPNLATFRPGGVASIEAVANAMPSTPGLAVTVVGHTANDGTGNGLALSLRRANAAKAIILTKRPTAVVTTRGVGFYEPKPGFPIDSQTQRRVVISYASTTTVSAKAKQWIKQTVSVSQPKSARYPLELTAAALVKIADDWSVEDANMVTIKVVARRGAATVPWDAQKGTGETSYSDTDPVDRWMSATASATIPADGRTYNVDVYLYAAAAATEYALVALWPEELLYFWGQDQALIFKGIAEHIQSTALGHGDLNIETRTPLTGIKRDRTYPFREHMPADTALEEFAGLNRGMDYDTIMTPDNRVILATFYPQQGQHTGYTLVQGGNVAGASPERSRDVASSVIMQSQDIGSYRAEAYARDSSAFGGLLLERVVTAEQGTPVNELRDAARQELAWGRTSTSGWWLDIDPEAITEVNANVAKGDVVRLILDSPRAVDRLARVINRERMPGGLRLLVALEPEA